MASTRRVDTILSEVLGMSTSGSVATTGGRAATASCELTLMWGGAMLFVPRPLLSTETESRVVGGSGVPGGTTGSGGDSDNTNWVSPSLVVAVAEAGSGKVVELTTLTGMLVCCWTCRGGDVIGEPAATVGLGSAAVITGGAAMGSTGAKGKAAIAVATATARPGDVEPATVGTTEGSKACGGGTTAAVPVEAGAALTAGGAVIVLVLLAAAAEVGLATGSGMS